MSRISPEEQKRRHRQAKARWLRKKLKEDPEYLKRKRKKYRKYYKERYRSIIATDPDFYRRNEKKLREADPSFFKRGRLWRTYRITLEELEEMEARQKHRCMICMKRRRLYIDHVKGTKIIRGLLCMRCNCAIGLLEHKWKIARRASLYLKYRPCE